MGELNQYHNYVILDIETGPDLKTAKLADAADPDKTPLVPVIETFESFKKRKIEIGTENVKKRKYKKQETIDEHMKDVMNRDYKSDYKIMEIDYKQKIQKLALNHPFAYVKFVTLIIGEGNDHEILTYRNENNDPGTEKKILETVSAKIYSLVTGGTGTKSHELVTNNGKHFDIPLMIERSGVRNANVPFRWLEQLTARGDRFNHYDMMEYRAYMNTPVNKLSLSRNLAIRFGIEFAKKKIDFATCSMEELEFYAIDEALKLEYWYKIHNGMKVLSPEEFLADLPVWKKKDSFIGREIPDV